MIGHFMGNIKKFFILLAIIFLPWQVESAPAEPQGQFYLSEKVAFLDIVQPEYFYFVFNPDDIKNNGGWCAGISGVELIEFSNDLRKYGTCFKNDPGIFEIVEMLDFAGGTYSDLKNSESFVSSRSIEILF